MTPAWEWEPADNPVMFGTHEGYPDFGLSLEPGSLVRLSVMEPNTSYTFEPHSTSFDSWRDTQSLGGTFVLHQYAYGFVKKVYSRIHQDTQMCKGGMEMWDHISRYYMLEVAVSNGEAMAVLSINSKDCRKDNSWGRQGRFCIHKLKEARGGDSSSLS